MVQEVQTPMIIPPLNTLEVIEGVGTSSVKIRYGRQTTGRTISYCTAKVNTASYYLNPGATMTDIEGGFNTLVNTGKTDYAIGSNYLRFPVEGSYEITIVPFTGYSGFQVTTIAYLDGKQVFSYLSNDNVDVEKKFKLDVGKYSKLTVQFTAYRNSSSGITFNLYADIGITQL